MLFVSILIIVIIIVIETIYIYFNKEKVGTKEIVKKELIVKNSYPFIELLLNDSIELTHSPGYIYTEVNDNIFLKYDNEIVLMKKDIIYDIDSKFNIGFILTDSPIKYFYYQK